MQAPFCRQTFAGRQARRSGQARDQCPQPLHATTDEDDYKISKRPYLFVALSSRVLNLRSRRAREIAAEAVLHAHEILVVNAALVLPKSLRG